VHEITVSEEECFRAEDRNGSYTILPVLPELRIHDQVETALSVPEFRTLLGPASTEIAKFMSA